MKKVFIKTYGCQMNVYDSGRMADALAPLGFAATDRPDDAELVILNTCHIREKAAEKVFSELGRLNQLKTRAESDGRRMVIGVGGCVAQAEGAEIIARAPYVDMVFGPQTTHRLPEMVARAFREPNGGGPGGAMIDTDFDVEAKFDDLPANTAAGATAFLTIQEGCDKFCTFCVVPYTRGPEFSRAPTAILAEARALVAAGAREITLLGQNVNAYRYGDGKKVTGLADLIHMLSAIDTLARLRYTTSHPRDMDDKLIAAHGTGAGAAPKLMPYLHLPVQSGSDAVLDAMNRGHGRERYLDIVARLRSARPDIALSSDFIVGFPGETERDFAATLDLVAVVGFAQAYSFKYSPRPGTPAADMDAQVPEAAKTERLAALQALLADQQASFNASHLGRPTQILFEGAGREKDQYIGRTPYNQSVHVTGAEDLTGQIRRVTLTETKSHSLAGKLTDDRALLEVGA
ncbi:MAG: tRNA (N6-isopentenyl adenosine(37)-C2)-methylthiotransferase MiaB [Alphaproteobacteria bacterium]|nr:tRNA (N6-isopentenyl adenosine(37)-C2)-methylthiotransferase MiaB [Alphaproteobacteria bacterium]